MNEDIDATSADSSSDSTFLTAALNYASRGFSVFPVHSITQQGGCTCATPGCHRPGKHPRTPNGLKDASTDPNTLRIWWTRWPAANIAVATGDTSSIFVIDIDGPEGEASFAEFLAVNGSLPDTLTAQSGSGVGRHLFFRHPGPGIKIKTSVAQLTAKVDIRGDGGYVVLAPSAHVSGERYRWLNDADIAAPPDWLLERVTDKPKVLTPRATPLAVQVSTPRSDALSGAFPAVSSSYGLAALKAECATVAAAAPGTQEATLNRSAYSIGQLVAGCELNLSEARHTLTLAGLQMENGTPSNPWTEHSITAKIDKAFLDAEHSPRTAPLFPSIMDQGSDVEIAYTLRDLLFEEFGNLVHDEGEFWAFGTTHWTKISQKTMECRVHPFDGTPCAKGKISLSQTRIASILKILEAPLSFPNFFADAPIGINCLSGFIQIDPQSGEITTTPHHPDHRQRHVIKARYNPHAPAKPGPLLTALHTGAFSDQTPEEAAARLLLLSQVGGAAIAGMGTKTKKPKAAILLGVTAENGKSQFLDCFRAFLPKDATCSFTIQQIGEERYVPQLSGKLLNTCDELSSAAVSSDSFKRVVTGETISGREVYKSAVEFRPAAQHVFSTNLLPSFTGGADRGVRRRLMVIPFSRSIPDAEKIENLGIRIAIEEADALLSWLLSGAKSLATEGFFTESADCIQALDSWLFGSDPVLAWLTECCEITGNPADIVKGIDAYNHCKDWAEAEGFGGMPAAQNFKQRVLGMDKEGRIKAKKTNSMRGYSGLKITSGDSRNPYR